jgi:hypothetical protein
MKVGVGIFTGNIVKVFVLSVFILAVVVETKNFCTKKALSGRLHDWMTPWYRGNIWQIFIQQNFERVRANMYVSSYRDFVDYICIIDYGCTGHQGMCLNTVVLNSSPVYISTFTRST